MKCGFCRTEAKGIPDVMISPHHISTASPRANEGEPDPLQSSRAGENGVEVTASPAWICKFMQDFLELRLKLQRCA